MMTNEHFIQKEISFNADGLKLKGVLHLPDTVARTPVVIGSHGLYSSANSPKQIVLAEHCNHFGIAYFRFDHRGCGRSEGEFDRVTSLEARCRDLIAAVAAINSRIDTGDRLGLFGSSLGGTVCLSTAARLAAAVVTLAAPIRSKLIGNQAEKSRVEIVFDAAKRQFDIKEGLSKITNILIFHGDADEVVPVSHAREIYKFARKPKKMIIQKQGDHRMSNREHQKEFVREASRWFKRKLKL